MKNLGELRAALRADDVDPQQLVFVDTFYQCPTRDWLERVLPVSFERFRRDFSVGFEDEVFDCDDFAGLARTFASILHARTQGHKVAGLAFGLYGYYRTDMTSHMINVAFVVEDGVLRPVYWEPQTGKVVNLKPEERQSCDFVLL